MHSRPVWQSASPNLRLKSVQKILFVFVPLHGKRFAGGKGDWTWAIPASPGKTGVSVYRDGNERDPRSGQARRPWSGRLLIESDRDPCLLSGHWVNHQDCDEEDNSYQLRRSLIDRDTSRGEARRLEETLPNSLRGCLLKAPSSILVCSSENSWYSSSPVQIWGKYRDEYQVLPGLPHGKNISRRKEKTKCTNLCSVMFNFDITWLVIGIDMKVNLHGMAYSVPPIWYLL